MLPKKQYLGTRGLHCQSRSRYVPGCRIAAHDNNAPVARAHPIQTGLRISRQSERLQPTQERNPGVASQGPGERHDEHVALASDKELTQLLKAELQLTPGPVGPRAGPDASKARTTVAACHDPVEHRHQRHGRDTVSRRRLEEAVDGMGDPLGDVGHTPRATARPWHDCRPDRARADVVDHSHGGIGQHHDPGRWIAMIESGWDAVWREPILAWADPGLRHRCLTVSIEILCWLAVAPFASQCEGDFLSRIEPTQGISGGGNSATPLGLR